MSISPQLERTHPAGDLERSLGRAKQLAADLLSACRRDDATGRCETGEKLTRELQLMWELRSARTDEWASVVNFLQSAVLPKEYERFGAGEAEAVLKVLEDELSRNTINPEAVIRANETLRRGGLDPWKAISMPDQ